MKKKAFLALEDGSCFYGYTTGSPDGFYCAEIIFNTALYGYQEVCTDPSYANQIVVFTSTHIGNVGINFEDYESKNIWVKGVIAREISKYTSNWRADESFTSFLEKQKIPWIEQIDTRKLTRHLRLTGSQNGCISVGDGSPSVAISKAKEYIRPEGLNLFKVTKTKKCDPLLLESNYLNKSQQPLVCIFDFGVKNSIIEKIKEINCIIKVFPGDFEVEKVLALKPQGIVLSNGPGDPSCSQKLIRNIQKLVDSRVPILGICFGFQLLGLALGCRIKKMKFGHHGINHPVYDLEKKKVFITSQNHNFMVDQKGFPESLEITHVSLFDNSIQGFRSTFLPILAFQGHPEGSPGPKDLGWIFKDFRKMIEEKSLICPGIQK